MSSLKEGSACPDGYRALSTAELRELLQSDDKMDQIIRLNEKVGILRAPREPKCREESAPLLSRDSALVYLFFQQSFSGLFLIAAGDPGV